MTVVVASAREWPRQNDGKPSTVRGTRRLKLNRYRGKHCLLFGIFSSFPSSLLRTQLKERKHGRNLFNITESNILWSFRVSFCTLKFPDRNRIILCFYINLIIRIHIVLNVVTSRIVLHILLFVHCVLHIFNFL